MKRSEVPLKSKRAGGKMSEAVAAGHLQSDVAIDRRIGDEVRHLRKARGMTLAALSRASGLSQGYLSQVERGISSPSVKALHSISKALDVTISWFFMQGADGEDELRDHVVRANNRRKLSFTGGITDELLSPNLGRQLELLRCTFAPGSESGDTPYSHHGEEAGVVLEGELDLWIGEKHVVLREGDSFAFESTIPHRYANRGERECVVVWAITPPTY
jgi:transcriptional regulator with XRE-family HTH domain